MRRTGSLLLAVALVATACGSDATDESTTTTTTTTTTTVPTTSTTRATTTTTEPDLGPTSPLTGLPVDDPTLLDRRAIVVKVDNAPEARPQSGLAEADVMMELSVEGITRFVAVFHAGDSEQVGPVRSMRPTDWQIGALFDAPILVSGGQDWVVAMNRRNGAEIIGEVGAPQTFRTSSRRRPHNLYSSIPAVRDLADSRGYDDEPPNPLWSFGDLPSDADEATEIELDFSSSLVATWAWDGDRYLRETNGRVHEWVTAEGDTEQVSADVLVVLYARTYTQSPPPGGGPARAVESIGSGRAIVFAGGRVVEGTWSRPKSGDPIELLTEDGDPLFVPPGRPWISLFPSDRTVSW